MVDLNLTQIDARLDVGGIREKPHARPCHQSLQRYPSADCLVRISRPMKAGLQQQRPVAAHYGVTTGLQCEPRLTASQPGGKVERVMGIEPM